VWWRGRGSQTPLPPSFALSRSGWSPFPALRGRKESSFSRHVSPLLPACGEKVASGVYREPDEGASPLLSISRSAPSPNARKSTSPRNPTRYIELGLF
jgi:hypothetical protein